MEDGHIKIYCYGDHEQNAPRRAHLGDAGFDLYVAEPTKIPPNSSVNVPCGFEMELPDGWWAMVTGRSSTLRKRGLLVVNGVIDNGYRGPMFCTTQNLGGGWVTVEQGERLAQMILLPIFNGGISIRNYHEPRTPSTRGTDGFGSTGL